MYLLIDFRGGATVDCRGSLNSRVYLLGTYCSRQGGLSIVHRSDLTLSVAGFLQERHRNDKWGGNRRKGGRQTERKSSLGTWVDYFFCSLNMCVLWCLMTDTADENSYLGCFRSIWMNLIFLLHISYAIKKHSSNRYTNNFSIKGLNLTFSQDEISYVSIIFR